MNQPSKTVSLAFLALTSVVPVVLALQIDHRFRFDDQLITLAFAKNLRDGNGFVFNHPPPILASTSPLFTFVVAGLGWLFPFPLTAIAIGVGAICWSSLGWLFFAFRRELGLDLRAVVLIALVLAATGWTDALGMETYPFLALLVLALGLYCKGFDLACGTACALLFLCRGEGALLFLLLVGTEIGARFVPLVGRIAGRPRDTRSIPFLLLGFLLVFGAWCLYAFPTFGDSLPNTLAAKRIQGETGLWPSFAPELFGVWIPGPGDSLALNEHSWVSLWTVGILGGVAALVFRYPRLRILGLWGLGYVAGYIVLNIPAYHWYAWPGQFVLSVLFALGINEAWNLLGGIGHALAGRVMATIATTALLVPLAASHWNRPNEQATNPRNQAYYEVSRWFRENADQDGAVAALEVGYLGYYTEQPVLDLIGLTSPEALPGVARGDFGVVFWKTRPRYLLYVPQAWMFYRRILEEPAFAQEYARLHQVRVDGFDLVVYGRNDAPSS